VVECSFVENALARRQPHRAEHLERVRRLMATGDLLVAGAFDDMARALVFQVESEAEVVRLIEEDVYWREGDWTDRRVSKLHRVVPSL
jgi:uncharacterized protein YciI